MLVGQWCPSLLTALVQEGDDNDDHRIFLIHRYCVVRGLADSIHQVTLDMPHDDVPGLLENSGRLLGIWKHPSSDLGKGDEYFEDGCGEAMF